MFVTLVNSDMAFSLGLRLADGLGSQMIHRHASPETGEQSGNGVRG